VRNTKHSIVAAMLLLACAGCTPTVAIEPPSRPIAINLNIKLDADVRIRVEEKAKIDVGKDPIFSLDSVTASTSPSLTRSIATPGGTGAMAMLGERYDGYVVARDASVPATAADIAARVNVERMALYEKRAKEEKVPVAAVGAIYASEILKSAPTGTNFLDATGKWTQL
jgi:hypothetical protein